MTGTRRLVERARRGDAGAFENLVRAFYRSAYAVAFAKTGNAMDAEDVVQESFVKALERLDECDPDRFGAWLLTIVRNRAHNVRERERVRAAAPLETVAAAAPERADRTAERHELAEALTTALSRLPEAQRAVVLLHDLEGLPHREIAEALGISEVMARQHLFQARRALRSALGGPEMREYLHG